MVRITVERALAQRVDEAPNRGVVDLMGLDALPARMTRQTREPNAISTLRKLGQQLSPTRAQGALARRQHWSKATGIDGRKEVGTDVTEGLGRKPSGDRANGSELGAEHRKVERNLSGLIAQELGYPGYGRAQVAEPIRRGVLLPFKRIEHRF